MLNSCKKSIILFCIAPAFLFSFLGKEVRAADEKKLKKPAVTLPAKEHFRRGKIYYMNGDFEKARASFAEVVRLDSKNAGAWHFLGGAKHRLGDFAGAIRDYSRAIELSPKSYHSFHNRALSKHHQQNLGAAIDDYSKAISINRDYFRSWYFRGLAKFERGDFKGAIEDLTVLLAMKPFHYKAWYVIGMAKFLSGDKAGAMRDFNQATRLANKKLPSYEKKINPFSVTKKKSTGKLKPADSREKTKGKAKSF